MMPTIFRPCDRKTTEDRLRAEQERIMAEIRKGGHTLNMFDFLCDRVEIIRYYRQQNRKW